MMRAKGCILALSVLLFASGCQAVAIGVATPMVVQQKRVNLLNSSYAAADILAQQSSRRFPLEVPLVVSDLQENIDMTQEPVIAHPKVGKVLSEQMRMRFTQLGYTLADENRVQGKNHGDVSGTYEIRDGTMAVSLRMVDRRNGRLVGTYDYSLPVTYDIKKYMTRSANSLPPLPPLF